MGIRTVRHYEYETEQATHSEERAAELARYTLRCLMAEELAGAELLKEHTTGTRRDTSYVLLCRVTCIENIAKTVEIPLRGLP